MDRKGIMLKALVAIILTLIVFIPTCMFVSQFFKFSSSTNKESFVNLVNDLKATEKARNLERLQTSFSLDEGSAVVYFRPNVEEVIVEVDAEGLLSGETFTDHIKHIKRPSACILEKNCICLIENPIIECSTGSEDVLIIDSEGICETFDINFELKGSCSIGKGYNLNSQTCINGFMIERNLINNQCAWSDVSEAYYENSKVSLQLTKLDDRILVET